MYWGLYVLLKHVSYFFCLILKGIPQAGTITQILQIRNMKYPDGIWLLSCRGTRCFSRSKEQGMSRVRTRMQVACALLQVTRVGKSRVRTGMQVTCAPSCTASLLVPSAALKGPLKLHLLHKYYRLRLADEISQLEPICNATADRKA